MSFLEPTYDPTGLGTADEGLPVLQPNLPNATTALTRKYQGSTLSALHQSFDPAVVNSFLRWELDRARRGVYPTSPQQTVSLLKAAQTRQAQTPVPEGDPTDVLGNIASDVGQIVTSLPKIPEALAHEVQDLPNFQKRVQEGGGGIAGLLNAPGIRLIPGAFTARNIATGDFANIAEHPVQTVLDVLPYGEAAHVGTRLAAIPVGESTVGDIAGRAARAVGRTTIGNVAQEAFSPLVRKMMAGEAGEVAAINMRSNPSLAFLHPDDLSQLARESTQFQAAWQKDIPDPARRATITDAVETNLHSLPQLDLTDTERARVEDYMTLRQKFADVGAKAGEIGVRDVLGQPEELSTPQLKRYDALKLQRDRWSTITNLRNAILNPSDDAVTALADPVSRDLASNLPMAAKKNIAQGYIHALDAAGYDTGDLYTQAGKLTKTRAETFTADVADTITQTGNVITRRRTGQPPLEPPARWLTDNRRYTDASLAARDKALTRLEGRIVPSRWTPQVESAFNAKVAAALPETSPELPALTDAVMRRDYGLLIDRGIIDPAELTRWRNEAIQSWSQARAEGVEPTFVHHAPPGFTPGRGPARVTTVAPRPSQYADRTWDYTPHSNDLGVAIDHQRLELLRREGSQAFADWMGNPEASGLTRTRADVENELRPAAIARAQRRGIDYSQALEELMARSVVPWDSARTGFLTGKWSGYKFSDYAKRDQLFVARPVADAMRRMTSPSTLERSLNPVIGLFRTAVLPFSIRWQVNNIFGNAMMSAIEDPRTLLSSPRAISAANDIRKMNRAVTAGEGYELADSTKAILESMSPKMRSTLSTLEYSAAPDSLARVRAGETLGNWYNQIQRAKSAVDRLAAHSYSVNQMFDDATRFGAYVNEYDRAIARGASGAEAGAKAEALVNKIAPRWNEMTPLERSILRPIFPFYSFMSHVMRYAYRYPVDHPFRTAVAASLVRAEIQDQGTGLPQAIASMFLLGSPSPTTGEQTAIDVGAANPFRDLGDNLTFAGFMGQINPVFKVALTQLGYDPQTRGPNLYPQLEYDPKTGRMRQVPTTTPGLVGQLASAVVPQAAVLSTLLGTNATFRQLAASNPDAAKRMLLSQAGIPLLWRTVNVPQQAITAELNRQTDQKAVLSAAMKSGDYTRALRYPGLVPLIGQLQVLQQQGKLAPYTPTTSQDIVNAQQQLLGNVSNL